MIITKKHNILIKLFAVFLSMGILMTFMMNLNVSALETGESSKGWYTRHTPLYLEDKYYQTKFLWITNYFKAVRVYDATYFKTVRAMSGWVHNYHADQILTLTVTNSATVGIQATVSTEIGYSVSAEFLEVAQRYGGTISVNCQYSTSIANNYSVNLNKFVKGKNYRHAYMSEIFPLSVSEYQRNSNGQYEYKKSYNGYEYKSEPVLYVQYQA